ncbi:putative beta-amylase [Histomonas meleagridis]|uniref:putative beta-amylase n=1 Tax=Histomonas meleagridis TaxID=135588 RepID=UPI00355A5680|nr:putative beta-amylase [Histomonas meleagridis]KAH0802922.1 putative beta-amylase [Histomonas meleagridis]
MLSCLFALGLSTSFYVMAPLDFLDNNQNFKYQSKLEGWLDKMKEANVDGMMVDVWWGLVETSKKSYKWTGYETFFNMCKSRNLKIIPVMSFHKCGGNVGDTCNIPLPSFVVNAKPFFKDQNGFVDEEYISFGYDNTVIDGSRTPIQMYSDFMSAFKNKFQSYLNDGTIVEIEVGVGPCGEMRYPSYLAASGWSYPGCGLFQTYDDKMKALLVADAAAAGVPSFGRNPTNTGGTNTRPGGSQFWTDGQTDSWNSEYGQWFIKWYAQKLIDHGSLVLNEARTVFPSTKLSCKIAGIHWWYMYSCHCAEVTAGFNNFLFYDGYRDILSAFKRYNVDCCFTCLEMSENSQYGSNPPYLVQQLLNDSEWAGIDFEGENALEVYDWGSYGRITEWAKKGLKAFTFLRLNDNLINNYNTFKSFVNNMHNA